MLVGFCTYSRFILGTEMGVSASDLPLVKSLFGKKLTHSEGYLNPVVPVSFQTFFVVAGLVR